MNARLRRIAAVALVALLPGPVFAQGTYMGQAEVVREAPPIARPPAPYPGQSYGAPAYPAQSYGAQSYAPQQGAADAAFAQEQLDALVAPIALYPDQLLAQVLMAATFPLDVVEAARFVQQNPNLKGQALDNALASRPWDPSVLSLAAFPQVLQMMSERLDWTRELGDAFLADQDRVMQTVQDLRQRAQSTGNLVDSPQQRVIVENRTIYIEPAQPDVIYVPYYNPTVVYGPWWAPGYVPFHWRPSSVAVIGGGMIAFSSGYYVTRNHWGWARPDWRTRHIAIDFNRGNFFIERRPYYRDWVRDGRWEHRGDRWRDSRWGRPVARGPVPSVAPGRNSQWEGRGRGEAPRVEGPRPDRPRTALPAERPGQRERGDGAPGTRPGWRERGESAPAARTPPPREHAEGPPGARPAQPRERADASPGARPAQPRERADASPGARPAQPRERPQAAPAPRPAPAEQTGGRPGGPSPYPSVQN